METDAPLAPPVVAALFGLFGGPAALALSLGSALALALGAWLLREGLRAEAAFATRLTARRLALKAASRLRRKGYRARELVLHARFEDNRERWAAHCKLPVTQDSFVVLARLEALLPRLLAAGCGRAGGFRLRMVGVTLAQIEPVGAEQGSLWAHLPPDDPLAREARTLGLSRAMDRINQRWGRNAVSVGPLGGGRLDRVGTKIAFGRIPDLAEFRE